MEVSVNYDHDVEGLRQVPVEGLARFVMKAEGLPENAQVSVSFVTDEAIADLNERYRHHEGPTDVLSFECDNVDDGFDDGAPADAPYEMGDIVIAPDVARAQMGSYGTTFAEEVETLLCHGLLHLCGYDHIDPADAKVMLPRQDELLRQWWSR